MGWNSCFSIITFSLKHLLLHCYHRLDQLHDPTKACSTVAGKAISMSLYLLPFLLPKHTYSNFECALILSVLISIMIADKRFTILPHGMISPVLLSYRAHEVCSTRTPSSSACLQEIYACQCAHHTHTHTSSISKTSTLIHTPCKRLWHYTPPIAKLAT